MILKRYFDMLSLRFTNQDAQHCGSGRDCYILYNISNDVFNSNEFDDEVNKNDEQRSMDEGWCETIAQS